MLEKNNNQMPVFAILEEIKLNLEREHFVSLSSPPGSGKTTVLPLLLKEETWLDSKKILILVPRRIAAISASSRISNSLSETIGGICGYRIRFDTKVSNRTKIEFATDGILNRIILKDPSLSEYGLIIFDEFHERNMDSDLGLSLTLRVKNLFRPDLRILVMSATLEGMQLGHLKPPPKHLEAKGAVFPVLSIFQGDNNKKPNERILDLIPKAVKQYKGDILVFLPGSREIRDLENKLNELSFLKNENIIVFTLYGELSLQEQNLAIQPNKEGKRKIILSTNIAETSLTVEGVSIVIDSGYCRRPIFNVTSGLTKLKLMRISRNSSKQREGRAGRTGPGICIKLWSEEEEKNWIQNFPPEITNSDLTNLVIQLKSWGEDPKDLQFVDFPPLSHYKEAESILTLLGAIDENGNLTENGKNTIRFPLIPRLAIAGLRALHLIKPFEIAAFLSLIEERIEGRYLLENFLKLKLGKFESFKNPTLLRKRVEQIGKEFESIKFKKVESFELSDDEKIQLLCALTFPDRIAKQRKNSVNKYKFSNGKGGYFENEKVSESSKLIVVLETDGDTTEAKIVSFISLNEELFYSHFKNKFREVIESEWIEKESKKPRIFIKNITKFLELEMEEKEKQNNLEEVITPLLFDFWKRFGIEELKKSNDFNNLIERNQFLIRKGFQLIDVNFDSLLQTIPDWLFPFYDFKKNPFYPYQTDPFDCLLKFLPYDQKKTMDKEAPIQIEVPSGSKTKIEYSLNGPKISVKLQELFGWAESPKIAGEPILIQLLSPSREPVQITRDLRSFWDKTYFEVRKELKGKYPKHPWPDDPWNAQAKRGTKKQSF